MFAYNKYFFEKQNNVKHLLSVCLTVCLPQSSDLLDGFDGIQKWHEWTENPKFNEIQNLDISKKSCHVSKCNLWDQISRLLMKNYNSPWGGKGHVVHNNETTHSHT